MRQRALIFLWLEVVETMRSYIAYNMDKNKELLVDLETARSEVATARKLAEKGASLLRKIEEEKKTFQAEAHWLAKEKLTMAAEKEKVEEETVRLRRELQDFCVGFSTQEEDLEVDYQKQVDVMFFYDYQCCIKKHGIANDTHNFPSNDEENESLGDLT